VNPTVYRVSLRESLKSAVILSVGLGAFFYLVLLSSAAFIDDIRQVPFVQDPPRVFEAFLGGAADFARPSGWLVTGMMHPIVLSLQTAGALTIAAGAVATELERGTLELVLTRPVPRWSFLLAKMTAALTMVTIVQLGGLAGVLIARPTVAGVEQIAVAEVLRAFLGSWVLFAAFAMVATYLSARSSLRGRALGAAVGVVVASFFVNFISLLFDEVEALGLAFQQQIVQAAEAWLVSTTAHCFETITGKASGTPGTVPIGNIKKPRAGSRPGGARFLHGRTILVRQTGPGPHGRGLWIDFIAGRF
jgi:ABC-2 type transport system permease protein